MLIPVKEKDAFPDREVLRHTGNLVLSQVPVFIPMCTPREGGWLLFLLITLITIISKDNFPIKKKKKEKKFPLWHMAKII